eukprot:gene18931-1472_t
MSASSFGSKAAALCEADVRGGTRSGLSGGSDETDDDAAAVAGGAAAGALCLWLLFPPA